MNDKLTKLIYRCCKESDKFSLLKFEKIKSIDFKKDYRKDIIELQNIILRYVGFNNKTKIRLLINQFLNINLDIKKEFYEFLKQYDFIEEFILIYKKHSNQELDTIYIQDLLYDFLENSKTEKRIGMVFLLNMSWTKKIFEILTNNQSHE